MGDRAATFLSASGVFGSEWVVGRKSILVEHHQAPPVWHAHTGATVVGDRSLPVTVLLREDRSHSQVTGVSVHDERAVHVCTSSTGASVRAVLSWAKASAHSSVLRPDKRLVLVTVLVLGSRRLVTAVAVASSYRRWALSSLLVYFLVLLVAVNLADADAGCLAWRQAKDVLRRLCFLEGLIKGAGCGQDDVLAQSLRGKGLELGVQCELLPLCCAERRGLQVTLVSGVEVQQYLQRWALQGECQARRPNHAGSVWSLGGPLLAYRWALQLGARRRLRSPGLSTSSHPSLSSSSRIASSTSRSSIPLPDTSVATRRGNRGRDGVCGSGIAPEPDERAGNPAQRA
ncbi:hypothetical protein AAFF_G00151180 [Aldrovandia affinis]|uniref:Uncharacterized protein n=1 Tax=Aldrovandia affinis TaxID=143900 RepID=A0AAD7W8D4_9TELE|nr:hypothetical protein AAFF_G00151180 [Aldrovandia affinis]